jgi:hypothetical protein
MMKFLTVTLLFVVTLFAQDKGYIDMHGGKKDNLTNNKSSFSNSFSGMSSLGMKSANTNKNKTELNKNSNTLKTIKQEANKKNEKL